MPAHGRSYARFAAFLDGGVAAFDAGALRFSRGEGVALDPHARLLLEQTQVDDEALCTFLLNFSGHLM
jgi:acyl transferase domain-containing protein